MRPCYALLPCGAYVSLHLMHWFGVMLTDRPGVDGYDVLCGAPGQEDLTVLYTWSAYPEQTEHGIVWKDGRVLTGNELAANEMLERLMAYLVTNRGGLIEINEIADGIAEDLGLEGTAKYDGPTRCPGCGELYTPQEWAAWEDWQGKLVGTHLVVGVDGPNVSLEDCCEPCADAYFADDTCAHRTADGSMEAA